MTRKNSNSLFHQTRVVEALPDKREPRKSRQVTMNSSLHSLLLSQHKQRQRGCTDGLLLACMLHALCTPQYPLTLLEIPNTCRTELRLALLWGKHFRWFWILRKVYRANNTNTSVFYMCRRSLPTHGTMEPALVNAMTSPSLQVACRLPQL